MNKILRYSFVALLAMVFGNVSAQEVTLDFTITDPADANGKTSIWGFPAGSTNKTVEENPFTYGGYTVKVAGSTGEGYYWHDKDHYLLFGKKGAYVTLPAFDFDVSKIEVEGNSGASASTKQNIFVGDEAVSTETTGAKGTNTYEIAEAYQAAGNVYTIKVTSSHNDQIKTIKIYKKGAAPTVVAPKFSVPGGTYYEPQTVALTCETEGAKILYTIPAGQDPEYTNDNQYTGVFYDGNPLTISKTTTIKAMAVKDGKTSSIVSATYTIEELQTLSLAQAQAADKGAAVIVEGVVVASAANGAVLSDGTDYLYYYNTANPLTIGQIVRMSGQLGEYGGAKQLTSTATITELGTETVIQPTPVKLAASDFESIVTAKVAERKYVSFEGTLTISGNYFNIAIEGTEDKAIGSIVKPKENLTELSGKKVVVTGYLMYVNSKYVYAVATSVEDASSAGINTISADKAKNGARYNLAGQKVNAGYKGVVIMNGQKVMQ